MKPILLLGAVGPGGSPAERWLVDLRRLTPAEENAVDSTDWAAVIVMNDGGACTLRRLLTACGMRERQEDLCIGVLSYLDDADKRPGALIEMEPRLKFELKGEALRLEYQAR